MPPPALDSRAATQERKRHSLSAILEAVGEAVEGTRRGIHAAVATARNKESQEHLSDEIRAVLGRYRV